MHRSLAATAAARSAVARLGLTCAFAGAATAAACVAETAAPGPGWVFALVTAAAAGVFHRFTVRLVSHG